MLTVAYDGTAYCGWQIQPDAPTIEGVLDKELSRLLGEDIHVIGASRTDAGVHAEGAVAVFDTSSSIPDDNNITEISRLCGFKEPLYFSRMFKKKYGVAPSFYFAESQKQTSPTNSEDVKVMLD